MIKMKIPLSRWKYSGARQPASLTVFRSISNETQAKKFILPLQVVFMKMITLCGEEHADTLFEHIKIHVCKNDAPVMEMRAGQGHLTKRLLESGVKNLHVFERRTSCQPILKDIASQYPDQCTLHHRTFNDTFFENSYIPAYNSPYLKESIPFKCKRRWEESPSFKVIATHSNGKVLLVALTHVTKNMMYFGMGRPQFILTIPAINWEKLLMDPKKVNYQDYQRAGLLFPDFYDFEVLGSIGPPVKYNSGEVMSRVAKEEYVTVSLAPKKELIELVDPIFLEEYLFFGTQTMNGKAKHSYVIATLEKWAPGSGKKLVANGVDCFTQFTDLSSREAVRIFKLWKSAPNYNSSIFMHEYEDYIKYSKY